MGPVGDLGEALAAISFLIGLTFGLTFDTAGARREVAGERYARERGAPAGEPGAYPPPRVDRAHEEEPSRTREPAPTAGTRHDGDGDGRSERVRDADEPLTAERDEHSHEAETEQRGRRFGFRRRASAGNREEA
jgi:hypothetical protein